MAASSSTTIASRSLTDDYSASVPDDYIENQENAEIFPEEVLLKIFSYMGPKELARSKGVCRLWRRIASDPSLKISFKEFLKVEFPKLPVMVIDESDWKEHVDLEKFGLSVDDAPVLDFEKTVIELKRLSGLPIEKDAGGTLLLKPKGISFNKVLEIAAVKPKQGPEFKFLSIWNKVKVQYGDIATTESCWVWFANNIIEGSRFKTPDEQNQMLADIGCEMPDVAGETLLVVLKFMMFEGRERLFDCDGASEYDPNVPNDKVETYTRCSNKVDGKLHVIVGVHSSHGLRISYNYFCRDPVYGVSPSRKFLYIGT